MEIKILVAENRELDLDNFIKTCESKGFELQNRGGGHMPNFSGYYATLKGSRWESIKSDQTQIEKLEAEKKELLEALEKATDLLEAGFPEISAVKDFQSLIKKHKL